MSFAVHELSLTEYSSLSLAELFSVEQNQHYTNHFFQIDDNNLVIDTRFNHTQAVTKQSTRDSFDCSDVELVVFDTLSVALLNELLETSDLSIQAVSAVNHRITKTSFRFYVSVTNLSDARASLSQFCLANQIEAALVENAPNLNEPGVLVMDMDSTTIKIECIDEIAVLAGVGEQVAEVTELAMQGKLDFTQSLHQRVATLENANEAILAEVAKNIPLMEGLENLIEQLQAHHWKVAIASGGFTYFADHLKELLSLDAAVANTLEIVDGVLTGKVLGDVVDANTKAQVLRNLQQEYQLKPTQTVAMGDGANDLTMMAAAQLGVAFHAKEVVQKQADSSINFNGLDLMLHWLK